MFIEFLATIAVTFPLERVECPTVGMEATPSVVCYGLPEPAVTHMLTAWGSEVGVTWWSEWANDQGATVRLWALGDHAFLFGVTGEGVFVSPVLVE